MSILKEKKIKRIRRKKSIKSRIIGKSARLRLTIFKSNKNIYAQIIDDKDSKTLVFASTVDKEVENLKGKCNIATAKKVGELLANRAKTKDIKEVVFDRNGYLYHGKVKAFADSCRENGLKF